MITQVLGCPLWFGKIKRRVAKKYHRKGSVWRDTKFLALMANIKEGDLVLDCSAFNVRITEIEPYYRKVGKGWVLIDIDLTNDKGGECSFVHCGVEPAWTRENIFKHWVNSIKYWKDQGDPWNFVKRYEFTTVNDDGTATVDYTAYKKKYNKD